MIEARVTNNVTLKQTRRRSDPRHSFLCTSATHLDTKLDSAMQSEDDSHRPETNTHKYTNMQVKHGYADSRLIPVSLTQDNRSASGYSCLCLHGSHRFGSWNLKQVHVLVFVPEGVVKWHTPNRWLPNTARHRIRRVKATVKWQRSNKSIETDKQISRRVIKFHSVRSGLL